MRQREGAHALEREESDDADERRGLSGNGDEEGFSTQWSSVAQLVRAAVGREDTKKDVRAGPHGSHTPFFWMRSQHDRERLH